MTTDYILIFMSNLIDEKSLISYLQSKQCELNKLRVDAVVACEYTAYIEGKYDMCQNIIDMIHNNKTNQRPHVGFKV